MLLVKAVLHLHSPAEDCLYHNTLGPTFLLSALGLPLTNPPVAKSALKGYGGRSWHWMLGSKMSITSDLLLFVPDPVVTKIFATRKIFTRYH